MKANGISLLEIKEDMRKKGQCENLDVIEIASIECIEKTKKESEHDKFLTIYTFIYFTDVHRLLKSENKSVRFLLNRILDNSKSFFLMQKGDAGFYGDEDCEGGPMDAGDFEDMDVYEYVSNVTFESSGLSPKAFKDAMNLKHTIDSEAASGLIIGYFFNWMKYIMEDYAKRHSS